MQLILDHIASLLVGGAVLLLVLSTQVEAQRMTAEQTTSYAARKATLEFADLIEEEFAMIGEGTAVGVQSITQNGAGETSSFEFWREDAMGVDTLIEYHLSETDSIIVAGETVQLYQVERYEDGTRSGGSPSTVRHFEVTLLTEDGTETTPANAVMVRIALVVAYPFGDPDDAQLFQTHWGITLNPVNLG